MFARAPRDLHPDGETGKPLGKCCGFAEESAVARGGLGYSTDDIFYLETCVFSEICSNGAEIFRLRAGQPFACVFRHAKTHLVVSVHGDDFATAG